MYVFWKLFTMLYYNKPIVVSTDNIFFQGNNLKNSEWLGSFCSEWVSEEDTAV